MLITMRMEEIIRNVIRKGTSKNISALLAAKKGFDRKPSHILTSWVLLVNLFADLAFLAIYKA